MAGGYRAEYCRPCLRIPISTRSHPRCDCFLVRALPQGGRQGRTRGRGSVGACGGANVWAQERNGTLGRREGGREEVTPGRRTRRQNQLPQARSSYGPSEPRAAQPREKPPRPPEAPPTRARPRPAPAQAQMRPLVLRLFRLADWRQIRHGQPAGTRAPSSDIQCHLFRPRESLLCGHVSWASN